MYMKKKASYLRIFGNLQKMKRRNVFTRGKERKNSSGIDIEMRCMYKNRAN